MQNNIKDFNFQFNVPLKELFLLTNQIDKK